MPRDTKPKDRVPSRQPYIHQYIASSTPWPESTVGEDATILRIEGCDKYALDLQEIENIPYKEIEWKNRKTRKLQRGFQYLERDLERKAREKYSSPESLKMEQARRWRRAQKKQLTAKQSSSSQAPSASTFPASGTVSQSDEGDADSDPDCDEEMQQMDNLAAMERSLKRTGKGWLWNMLDATFEYAFGSEAAALALRSTVILAAQGPFMSRYPVRRRVASEGPSLTMRPLSQSFTKFYKIMDDAFMPKNHVMHKLPDSDDIPNDWTPKYYDRVYWAFVTILKEHGPQGWKEARWVVYDKYTECKFGCVNLTWSPIIPRKWEWEDSAAFWLHRAEYKMGPLMKGPFLKLFDQKKRNASTGFPCH